MKELEAIRGRVSALRGKELAMQGRWSAPAVLEHCAQSIEASISGYPAHKSALFKATIGKLVLAFFLAKGSMSHDKNAAIPGLPEPSEKDLNRAVDRLLAAIDAFTSFDGEPAPHFVYGPVDKARYARVHAMHVEDHLSHLGS